MYSIYIYLQLDTVWSMFRKVEPLLLKVCVCVCEWWLVGVCVCVCACACMCLVYKRHLFPSLVYI